MSTPLDRRTLIKDLIILTGRSASSLASETGLSRSNVTHWLKHGGSSVGVERQDELLERLGVSGGSLSSKLVHNWILKTGDLSSVERILKWAGKKPYEMIYLVPDPVDWRYRGSDLVKFPLLIRSPDSISPVRIVLRRKPSILIPDSEIQEEDIILVGTGLVKWSHYREISSVKQDLYEKFIRKEISSQEYDQVWNSVKTLGEGREKEPPDKSMENKSDQYAEMLLAVLPSEGRKELLYDACKPVEPGGNLPDIPAELVAAMTKTPLEFLLKPENGILFGFIMGKVLWRIWEEEKK